MVGPGERLRLHPDRLLPVDPGERAVARRLYRAVSDLPVISPHGHVDPAVLLANEPFADPASLLVTPDHYVTRLLHADGVSLTDLGLRRAAPVGAGSGERLSEAEARRAWQLLCERWQLFAGTPVRDWLEAELAEIFGVGLRPSAQTAEAIYDQVAACLADNAYLPRNLFERFRLAVLATTPDICDDLSVYARLSEDPTWTGRVIPTFRPDRYLEPAAPGWADAVRLLGEVTGKDTGTYRVYLEALRQRREAFIAHGATSADHSHADVGTEPLGPAAAAAVYRAALAGKVSEAEGAAFRRHMTLEMAAMSCDDGLVMTLHPGVRRNHHRPTAAAFGPDTGHDIPTRVEFTDALRPLLERFGTVAGFHLVLFTVDETVWSRELAPLAGFYPSVYVGVPWWFLDAPAAIRRFRGAVGETAGFSRTSGFVDDTRAFCSIPARHDMSRRIDAGVLARLVCEHRLGEDEATAIAGDLVSRQPARVFKL